MKSIIIILILTGSVVYGQTKKDSVKVRKNLRFSLLGGPGYTPDYGFLLGGSALFSFSTDVKDTSLKRSILPIAFAYMTSGGGSVIIRPQLFFNKDRFRVFGMISMSNTIDNYYGVGYDNNTSIQRSADSTEYRNIGYKFNPILLFRFKQTNLFYGAIIDIANKGIKEPSIGMQKDEYYLSEGGDSEGLKYLNVGFGININYDTRDIPANSYKGVLVDLSAVFYSKAFGSTSNFSVYSLVYKQFEKLKFIGKRKVLAWMINTRITEGNVPLTELSMVGSAFDLRGYYMGQYRDRNSLTGIVEYRHMFNAGSDTKFKKILSKLGMAAWTGVGAISNDLDDLEGVMPNYGAGLRIELQPRMNFRIDVGHDPINNQTLMYFNMTEAF